MEKLRLGRLSKPIAATLVLLVVFAAGYMAGLRSAPKAWTLEASEPRLEQPRWVQFEQQPLQPMPDPRELIPLQPGPGQGPGQPQLGQGQGEECPLLIYQDGQLYRFDLPGQPMPGPGGPQPGPGMPGGSPELIPLEPNAPSLPSPSPQPTPVPPDSNPDQSI